MPRRVWRKSKFEFVLFYVCSEEFVCDGVGGSLFHTYKHVFDVLMVVGVENAKARMGLWCIQDCVGERR